MTQPSEERINTSLDAMRTDAATWKQASSDLDGPISAIGRLTLTDAEMSWFATERGVDTAYAQARDALEEMLRKAAKYFQQIGDNLETAARQYENDDAHASNEIEKSGSGLQSNR